jgi:hypothetical protein
MEIDRDFESTVIYPEECTICQHLISLGQQTCRAFPERIPSRIWNNLRSQTLPYPGD